MKDSGIEWIGKIPEDWKLIRLKFLFKDIQSGNWGKADSDSKDGTICLRVADFDFFNGRISDDSKWTYRKYTRDEIKKYHLNIGDILIEKSGGGDKTPVGRSVIFDKSYNAVFSNFLTRLQVKNNFYSKYVQYFLMTLYHHGVTRLYFNQTTGIQNLNISKMINREKIPWINLKNQKIIADFLDKKCIEIDNLSNNIQKEIYTLRKYRKTVITNAITRGLNNDSPVRDSGIEWIGNISTGTVISKLKFILASPMKYGASESGIEYNPELPRYIRITDITANSKLKTKNKLSLSNAQARGYILKDKTLLFARSGGTVGKTFLYRKSMGLAAFAGYLISANIDEKKACPKFVYYYTQSKPYEEWKDQAFSQATIQNIGADKYSNMAIPIFKDINYQKKIVSYLDSKTTQIDKIISQKQKQLSFLSDYKNSLIFEYVTGKKQVPSNMGEK